MSGADRLPPSAVELERQALGCVLLDPACLAELQQALGVDVKVFYDLRHQMIYEAMQTLVDRGQPIDLGLLAQHLKDLGTLEQIGGLAYLGQLDADVPSAFQLPEYARVVRDKHLLRRMLEALVSGGRAIYEEPGNAAALIDRIENEVLAVSQDKGGARQRTGPEVIADVLHQVETMQRGVGLLGGVRTHFGYLDKMTGGLHRRELVILAGRPSTGKTSLAMNMAANLALKSNVPVAVFSMEMAADDIWLRVLCSEARVQFHKLRTGTPTDEDKRKLVEEAPRVSAAKVHVDDSRSLGILALRSRARRLKARHDVQVIIVDYLQLMTDDTHTEGRHKSREQEVATISAGLKQMAMELNVPVVVLSQLNREMERKGTRKPQLSDLRDSGAIEQDADMVGLLYRPKSAEEDEDSPDYPVNLLIAKQRNGPTGDVQLYFFRTHMRFEDAYGNRGRQLKHQAPGISAGLNEKGEPWPD